MGNPEVSVIIPFRDSIKTIERSIKSILNQSFQKFELIVVNDGSTDGSKEIVEDIRDERLQQINLPAGGTVIALNEGIYSAKSEIIALLDPYDSATGERIDKQLNYLQLHSDCPVVSSCVHYIQDSTSRHIRPYINWTNSLVSRDDIFQRRFVNATVLNSTLMFRKSLMTTSGLFEDGEFPEDYEMILRWMSRGIPIHKLDEELIEWYDDEQRLSRRHLRYNSAAATKIKSKYFKKWLTEYFRTSPDILLWSNDSLSMKKVSQLESEGLNIVGYINENGQSKNGLDERPVFSLDEKPSRVLIVYYMEQFEPEEIPSLLIEKGLEEGVNFITMS